MRIWFSEFLFAAVVTAFSCGDASADCSLKGHPICNKKCSAVCRAYYDPGPPESCQTDCRSFLIRPNSKAYTLKLEGVSESQKRQIEKILDGE
jgi:hypothetical protein